MSTYHKPVADKPAETYVERNIAKLRNELLEHPEDELHIKQQILLFSHLKEKEDVVIGLALEIIAMDSEKIYASDCFLVLARMYAKKEQHKEAIDYYRKAIAADPENDQAIMDLAALYKKQHDYDSALEVYDYLNNDYYDYLKEYMYHNKGICYFKKKEYEKALECFQTCLETCGENDEEDLAENIGACYFNMNNFTEAFEWFGRLLAHNSQSASAHYGLGLCYQNTDDSYRALHHYFEAVKIKPDYTEAYNNIAAVTVNQEGDYKTGVEMLKKAIENCPEESLSIVYMNLARIYNTLREFTLAEYFKAEYMKSLGFMVEEDGDDD